MKVMEIRLEDDGDRIAVMTQTPHTYLDFGIIWGRSCSEVETNSEAADAIRNHLLGVIADVDWQKQLERTQAIGRVS